MNATQSMTSAAWDAQSLNDLKRQAGTNPAGKALQVAKQVEGMFVQMMLKSMRQALPQDGVLSTEQTRMFTSMYDQQIGQQIGDRGLGLAEVIVRQMIPSPPPDETAGTVPMPLDMARVVNSSSSEMDQMIRRALPRLPTPTAASPLNGDSSGFIAQLMQPAQTASASSGIPHHLILAQAALESGWGQRQIMTRDGKPSYNLFGIKASGSWQGKTTDIVTTEYENGVAKKVKASFRVYDSYHEAFTDYARLLSNNPRYAAVTRAQTPEQGAHALQAAGYATDPGYAKKLIGMIQQFRKIGESVTKAYSHDLSNLF